MDYRRRIMDDGAQILAFAGSDIMTENIRHLTVVFRQKDLL